MVNLNRVTAVTLAAAFALTTPVATSQPTNPLVYQQAAQWYRSQGLTVPPIQVVVDPQLKDAGGLYETVDGQPRITVLPATKDDAYVALHEVAHAIQFQNGWPQASRLWIEGQAEAVAVDELCRFERWRGEDVDCGEFVIAAGGWYATASAAVRSYSVRVTGCKWRSQCARQWRLRSLQGGQ